MTSGEIPALIIMDSISRLIPGALNNLESVLMIHFSHQLLDHPHYTIPRKFRNRSVPRSIIKIIDILINGDLIIEKVVLVNIDLIFGKIHKD